MVLKHKNVVLTHENVEAEVSTYLRDLAAWPVPDLPRDPVPFFVALKRQKVTAGRYRDVSVFELANRVMSDLVVLFAARRLLLGLPSFATTRVARVVVALGTAPGLDLAGEFENGESLVGECFNVAESFFPTKHGKAKRDLRKQTCEHKVIAFNHDAVRDPSRYEARDEFTYLLVNVAEELERAAAVTCLPTT